MIVLKRFSQILNTNNTPGFTKGRKYDQNLGRLGQMNTAQRELAKVGQLGKEMREFKTSITKPGKSIWQ